MRLLITILFFSALTGVSIDGNSQDVGGGQSVTKSIRIYPNPTNQSSDFVNIKVASLKSENVKLALHNIIGNEIAVETEIVDEHELRMKIKDLSSGYYLITVNEEQSNFRGIYKILIR